VRKCTATLVLVLTASTATADPVTQNTAIPVNAFLESLGVGVHMSYTDGAYANASQAISDLAYLGIHQVRDGTPNPNGGIPYRNYRDSITALVNAGNRFSFFVGVGSIPVSLQQIAEIERAHPGAVIAIEGPNEINNWPIVYNSLKGDAAGQAFQHDLYAAVKADKTLGHLPVYYFTGGEKIDLREHPGLADYANGHPYPYQGHAPGPRITGEFDKLFGMPYPRVITEAGYYNQPANPYGSGVDDATQAKLTLDLLLSAFSQGVSKTFLYQLRSAYPDPNGKDTDGEYGLFKLDNSPKPVATAIHNLTTILAPPATAAHDFAPGTLRYTLDGLPATANTMLLQRADHDYMLVVWAEPPIWNEGTHQPIQAPTTSVTVSFPAKLKSIRVFDPLTGTSAIQDHHDVETVHVPVSDHPVFVEVGPGS
jgi:hypothetical protein